MSEDIEKIINQMFRTLESDIEDLIDTAKHDALMAMKVRKTPTERDIVLRGKAINDFQWVARATSTEHTRQTLHFLRVREGIIEATNGHILLWCDSDKEDGLYGITGEHFNDGGNFPNTDKLKPSWDNWQPLVIEKQDDVRAHINGSNVVDRNYLHIITEGEPEEWEIAFSENSRYEPLALRHKTSSRRAVLMPMRGRVRE